MEARIPKKELVLFEVLEFFCVYLFVQNLQKALRGTQGNNNYDSSYTSMEGKGKEDKPIGRIGVLRIARRHWL